MMAPRVRKSVLLTACCLLTMGMAGAQTGHFRVLVLNQSGAWTHTSAVGYLKDRLTQLAVTLKFDVKHVDSATESEMIPDTLDRYQVIVLNNNNSLGNLIKGTAARAAFKDWLESGNGIFALHDVADHADLWPWFRDSVFGGTRFTQHSAWNSAGSATARVKWDDIPVDGVVRSQKPEYALLKAGTPGSMTGEWFRYPDEWASFTVNPRHKVDVLLRIDESSYDVPERMGEDHPVAWAYRLPALTPGARQGRFIYTYRGHDASSFSGLNSYAAPNDIWGHPNAPTYNFIRWSICWAAAASGKVDEGCRPSATPIKSARIPPAAMGASARNGILTVTARGTGRFEVRVFDVAGHRLARAAGVEGEYAFPGLQRQSLYLVRLSDEAGRVQVRRIAL